MALFGSSKKSRIGVDIGTASIKIVELEKDSNRFKLVNYGIFELEPGDQAITSPGREGSQKIFQLSDQDVVTGIKQVLTDAGIKSRDAIASIPSFPTFTTTITLPFLSEEELAKTVPYEARKYVPIPLTDVQLDWSVVGVHKDAPQPNVSVFIVAVPKTEVSRYQTIMRQAGLNLRALELENFALIRALIGNDLSPMAIINIGGRSTSILIVENGFQQLSRDYEVGGFEITNSIARALGITMKRAEEMKRSRGMNTDEANVIREAMSSLVDMMALEATKTIYNYEDAHKIKIARILLVGGLANMPHFIEYFAEKLGREIVPGNTLARVVLDPALDAKREELNSTFAVSLGLAMREI
ncbi:MAG: hypothetical protein A3A33_03420 [Candidatus Yanofskybacteria bacterium RIFCSPLOWO2_01_FULL_49_25]|uniref:SHS2 domain-containing protein n=1 Tax=Candidatus Yanofskybacteria bacterium RIFCSPLOWO2_01_FULL_49_25 TaxID=1802701 RepID=A0A1F8GTP8_9BACT|nr:MAG: hypothetical protein A3A33_03420 [Candidatus Yanofskybacteria bacterium RIFCSPLOWO2_01_FULL_49_25]